jgi:plastocyanin
VRLNTKALAACFVVAVPLAAPRVIRAQSLLDRPDHISADWVGNTGTLYFNFVHRFSESPPPEHKVSNFPTFLIATGFASKALVGVNYATNSSLAARYPNEWEFFGRYAPLQQDDGAPFDLGGQLDYNLAVKGVDGELSIARRDGPVRLIAVSRLIADTLGGDKKRFAFGGGGTLRLGRFLALAGDAATLTTRQPGEKIAWSAGVHVALPNTPHTLSLHVSNASTSTMQGLARGSDTRRYGFEFTIPIHMGRFFSSPLPTTVATERTSEVAAPDSAPPKAAVAPVTAPARPTPLDSTVVKPVPVDTAAARPTRVDTTAARPTRVDTTAVRPPTRPAPAAAAPTRPATPTPAPRAAPQQRKIVNARMKGQAFIPDNMQITVGTTVRWKNLDALIHTVTAADQSFNSGVIAPDGTYSHTFNKPGTYPIICLAHPFMKATVVVK